MTAISLPSLAAATSVRASGSGVAARHAELGAADAEAASAKTASAGERTRTSKGFRPTGPKPVAFANSATPALRRLQSRARGNEQGMTDEQDRERESRLTDENKFVEMTDEVAEETRQAAERLATDPVVNEAPADDS
jgi:hypothetical protein